MPSVLYSSTNSDILEAVVLLKAPNCKVNVAYPSVEILAISKALPMVFVINTLPPAVAPEYPVETLEFLMSAVPEYVNDPVLFWKVLLAIAVVPDGAPIFSVKMVVCPEEKLVVNSPRIVKQIILIKLKKLQLFLLTERMLVLKIDGSKVMDL